MITNPSGLITTPLPELFMGYISRGNIKPKNGSNEIDETCCSILILATAGPIFSIALVNAVCLELDISEV